MFAFISLIFRIFFYSAVSILCFAIYQLYKYRVYLKHKESQQKSQHIAIMVMGDLGRSPRMQYHALSVANSLFDSDPNNYPEVHLIGLPGATPHSLVSSHPRIHISYFRDITQTLQQSETIRLLSEKLPPSLSPFLFLGLKVIGQILNIQDIFSTIPVCRVVMIQNPPSIPLVILARLYCWFCGSKLVIDWHNFGYSILALGSLGKKNEFIVQIAKTVEILFGKLADANICVTNAMQRYLKNQWDITATSVHDQPPIIFQDAKKLSVKQLHDVLMNIKKTNTLKNISNEFLERYDIIPGTDKTIATEIVQSDASTNDILIRRRTCRPALFITSTSWTEDEDFNLLLDALCNLDSQLRLSENQHLPDLLMIITGRGPTQAQFLHNLSLKSLQRVAISTAWLRAEDYPVLLSCCDAGVSLHTSSSGLDLPMKVVDMMGVNLPVFAYDFPSLPELVQHGVNGFVFKTSKMLQDQMYHVLHQMNQDGSVTNPNTSTIKIEEVDTKTEELPEHPVLIEMIEDIEEIIETDYITEQQMEQPEHEDAKVAEDVEVTEDTKVAEDLEVAEDAKVAEDAEIMTASSSFDDFELIDQDEAETETTIKAETTIDAQTETETETEAKKIDSDSKTVDEEKTDVEGGEIGKCVEEEKADDDQITDKDKAADSELDKIGKEMEIIKKTQSENMQSDLTKFRKYLESTSLDRDWNVNWNKTAYNVLKSL